jgi:hypothetical protein
LRYSLRPYNVKYEIVYKFHLLDSGMRRWAFILAILGIFLLFLVLFFSGEEKITDSDKLMSLEENTKVIVRGEIIEERIFGQNYILIMDNGIELICNCRGYSGKNISATGIVSEFNGKKRIEVLRLMEEDN